MRSSALRGAPLPPLISVLGSAFALVGFKSVIVFEADDVAEVDDGYYYCCLLFIDQESEPPPGSPRGTISSE